MCMQYAFIGKFQTSTESAKNNNNMAILKWIKLFIDGKEKLIQHVFPVFVIAKSDFKSMHKNDSDGSYNLNETIDRRAIYCWFYTWL